MTAERLETFFTQLNWDALAREVAAILADVQSAPEADSTEDVREGLLAGFDSPAAPNTGATTTTP